MCGIVGILNLNEHALVEEQHLFQMLALIQHRGPDEFGIYYDKFVGLGSARLSIIDLYTGQQPMSNADATCWIVFNGEIFNYLELREQLEAQGHHFRTQSDTEVILHLYDEYGVDCLTHLNGQFALAIWDTRQKRLFCGRDRLGIRPFFYTERNGTLVFGSEIKALIAHPQIQAELDPVILDQIFTFWSALAPGTVFKEIYEIPPGHYLVAQDNNIQIERYWTLGFPGSASSSQKSVQQYADELQDLLIDATQIRLRADVPVGAYLSGGLDSSIIASIIRQYTHNPLDTFSITFDDPDFDESSFQRSMVERIGTQHKTAHITQQTIGDIFPDVIWHTETPLLRTAPAPMYLLSQLVHQNNYKVVMTGEGADEFFGGYNIFKETMIRRFWARQPESSLRPLLLQRLYPYLANSSRNTAFFKAFFRQNLTELDANRYSHILRWKNTARLKRFFSDNIQEAQAKYYDPAGVSSAEALVSYPDGFANLHPLEKAQYLEITIFMSQYLLSSQGDRMGMANSVEGRYPFLDHRVVEFANQLPPNLKLHHLTEKYLLKQIGKQWLPADIWQRPKHPYRAPIHKSFFHNQSPDYVQDMLSSKQLAEAGVFNSKAVHQLVNKIERGVNLSETDDMAVAGILSTQLLYHQFIQNFHKPSPLTDADGIRVITGDGVNRERHT